MRHGKFFWKIYYIFASLAILPLLILVFYASSLFKDFLITRNSEIQIVRTKLIKERLESMNLDSMNFSSFASVHDTMADARITIIDLSGKVIADSRENPSHMDNHLDRPEVIEALKGKIGVSQRYSFTLKEDYLYSAMPVYDKSGNLKFIIRTGYPLTAINNEVSNATVALLLSALFFAGVVLVVGFIIIKHTLKPISEIKEGAERFTRGEYGQKIFPPKAGELKSIVESLNSMAKQLDERLDIIGEQSNVQQAVLASMKEGVLAVDYDERILLLNKTAQDILNIADHGEQGKTLQEVVRISEIQKFFKKIVAEGNPQETEIILQHDKDKFLQVSGTLLYDVDNKALGALVVFNDISNLKHLDTIKRDLVANVSHELKTPVTTIKGFIETLKEGAIDDPKNAERFLDIVLKHIDRLNMLIDDLLTLSKLEQNPDEAAREDEKILPVLKSVIEDYEFKANEKKIQIEIKCDGSLSAKIHKNLIEQAIANLLDNAIKYSDKKSKIEVGAYLKNQMLNIYVEDEGYGISDEHMPRLFERFYRVDKGRSREEGGTGLGLAIVKHIVNALNGYIDVKSSLGKGSIFIIQIPQNSV